MNTNLRWHFTLKADVPHGVTTNANVESLKLQQITRENSFWPYCFEYMILRRPLCLLWWKATKPFSLLALKQMADVTNENHQISYLANLSK